MFADLFEAFFVGGAVAVVLVWVLAIVGLIVWIWALVDAIRNPNLDDSMRIVWVLVIVLTQIVGAVLYFALRNSTIRLTGGHPRG